MATHRIPAVLAAEAVTEAVAHCAGQGYAETAVLVDADGVTQAVLRGDRVGSHSLDSARDKAYTAASFKSDTLALVERSKTVPGFASLFTQEAVSKPSDRVFETATRGWNRRSPPTTWSL